MGPRHLDTSSTSPKKDRAAATWIVLTIYWSSLPESELVGHVVVKYVRAQGHNFQKELLSSPSSCKILSAAFSFLFLFSRAAIFYTFWNTDSRPILQNGMSSVLLAVVVPLCVSKTVPGAILMLMTIIAITREKLVSIIAICCSNLSFLARHRPAEPCPLCSTKHNAICHRLVFSQFAMRQSVHFLCLSHHLLNYCL